MVGLAGPKLPTVTLLRRSAPGGVLGDGESLCESPCPLSPLLPHGFLVVTVDARGPRSPALQSPPHRASPESHASRSFVALQRASYPQLTSPKIRDICECTSARAKTHPSTALRPLSHARQAACSLSPNCSEDTRVGYFRSCSTPLSPAARCGRCDNPPPISASDTPHTATPAAAQHPASPPPCTTHHPSSSTAASPSSPPSPAAHTPYTAHSTSLPSAEIIHAPSNNHSACIPCSAASAPSLQQPRQLL